VGKDQANPLLCEPGKKFSRLKAWLYLTDFPAAGKDNEAAGLRRGEFIVSVSHLVSPLKWTRSIQIM